jgi:hypothetical protein
MMYFLSFGKCLGKALLGSTFPLFPYTSESEVRLAACKLHPFSPEVKVFSDLYTRRITVWMMGKGTKSDVKPLPEFPFGNNPFRKRARALALCGFWG